MARESGSSLRAEAKARGVSVYQVRRERGEARGLSRRQSVGQAPRTGDALVFLAGRDPAMLQLSQADMRRAGRYMAAVGALAEGANWRGRKMTAKRFESIVKSWAPISAREGSEVAPGRYRLENDPARVLELLERRRDAIPELPIYEFSHTP